MEGLTSVGSYQAVESTCRRRLVLQEWRMRQAEAPHPSSHHSEPPAIRPTKDVLLALDDTFARLGLRFFLHTVCDHRVCAETTTVADAQLACDRLKPDTIVIDPTIEGGLGFGLIANLTRNPTSPRVVVLTADESLQSVQRAMKAGALAYVTTRDTDDVMVAAINDATVADRIISPRLSSRMAARLASGSIEMESGGTSVLSQRELDVYRLLGNGSNVKEIALSLAMAAKTVETYQRRIREKLGLKSAAELRSSAVSFLKSE